MVAGICSRSLTTASRAPGMDAPRFCRWTPGRFPVRGLVETITTMLCVFLHSLWVDTDGIAVCTPGSLRHALFLHLPPSALWRRPRPVLGSGTQVHTRGVMCGEPLPRLTLALLSALTCLAVRALRPGLSSRFPLEAASRSTGLRGEGTVTTRDAWSSALGPQAKCSLWEAREQGVGCSPFGFPFAPVTG